MAKHGIATASLDEKLFVIGGSNYQNGSNFREVEVFDTTSSQWASGTDLPVATRLAAAITFRDKIYLIGGRHDDNSRMNQGSSVTLYLYGKLRLQCQLLEIV